MYRTVVAGSWVLALVAVSVLWAERSSLQTGPKDSSAAMEATADGNTGLRRLTAATQAGAGGYYQFLGEGPIAVAHAKQLPGTSKFVLMEFGPTGREGIRMQPHPASNPLGRNPLWVWDKETGSWSVVPTKFNSICGGWSKLPNGQIGMFSGHYQTLDFVQSNSMNRIVLFDPSTLTVTPRSNLTGKRWYPTVITLPSGESYIPGGTWEQKPEGPWPKKTGADIYNHANNRVQERPLNAPLYNAGLGNWYMGALVLPTGMLAVINHNMMQVIDPYTGEAKASAPPLPASIKDLTWEFPRMGPQVHLKAGVLEPGKTSRFEFVMFGGSMVDDALKKSIEKCGPITCDRQKNQFLPCADVSVRMGVSVSAGGGYTFDNAWTVEKMPDRRCIFDGILLPNGNVVLLGGHREGVGDLTNISTYAGGNDPHNEAWTYLPSNPVGRRFVKTGATTRIARLYHGTSILTSDGDILVGGTSNAADWKGNDKLFDRTKLGVNEYRNELFHPSWTQLPGRPVITTPPPNWVSYGSSFSMGYSSAGKITEVVLYDLGGATHNYVIGHRAQQLAFTDNGAGVLSIRAPANANMAPPSHYVIFLLSGDKYSKGAWVQVRPGPPTPPTTMPSGVALIRGLSSTFDSATAVGRFTTTEGALAGGFRLVVAPGARADGNLALSGARGTGIAGFRAFIKTPGSSPGAISLQSPMVDLPAGKTCHAHVWMRAAKAGSCQVAWVGAGGRSLAANTIYVSKTYSLRVIPDFSVPAAGKYSLHINMGGSQDGTFDVDDLEVYC